MLQCCHLPLFLPEPVFPEEELPEEDPTLLELRDQLADVSMDDLSPRQAWELLADLQKKAKETK